VVVLLHGWPYDIQSFVDVTPLLDSIALMDALKIEKAIIGGFDWGARTADIMAALWPERCKGIVSVSGYLIGSPAANKMPLPPKPEFAWWYQYYFATENGRAGYEKYRHDFAKLIWQLASPKWDFDDATFDRTAASFDNPDHVAIVIHNYRWRIGMAEGESQYNDLENKLAAGLVIAVPAITLEGDANGAPHPAPTAYRRHRGLAWPRGSRACSDGERRRIAACPSDEGPLPDLGGSVACLNSVPLSDKSLRTHHVAMDSHHRNCQAFNNQYRPASYDVEGKEPETFTLKTLAEIPLAFHHINQNTVDRRESLARNEEQGLLILPTQR
jgi:pimeloyl-ACP methyl ester carboxylesterase